MAKTDQELVEHYKEGVTECLVCGLDPVWGDWTDYNGQIRCHDCGMTYQILGSHLSPGRLEVLGIEKDQVTRRYCDCYVTIDVWIDYWLETGNLLPLGVYIPNNNPILDKWYIKFNIWLLENIETYRADYKENFEWVALEQGKYCLTLDDS